MLFQRLYNWIKYKTLPPSVLFKNRLFIERDSKHKRIFNNFGLIFRNSKWTNYENYNIKTQFRLSFYKFLILFIVVFFTIFILFNFKKYYIISYFFNSLSFLFWMSYDALDYYFSFLVWLFTVSSSLFFNLLYSYFFFNNFSDNKGAKKIFSHRFFSNVVNRPSYNKNTAIFSKHDFNWILFSWINNNANRDSIFLENIFEKNINKSQWKLNHDFFIKLYKVTFFCKLSSSANSIYSKNLNLEILNNNFFKGNRIEFLKYCLSTSFCNKYPSIIFSFFLNKYENVFDSRTYVTFENFSISQRKNWNAGQLSSELSFYNFLVKTKSGSFFFKNFSFGDFSFLLTNGFEFTTLFNNITSQTNTAKWNRWLYKYSILHRKVLKNSHKLTLTKKLLNSGFYNTALFDKNLWASENFIKYNDSVGILNSFFNIYYPSLFQNVVTFKNNAIYRKNNSLNFEFLNFYENSFFWFLKRYYFFNNFSANSIKNKKIIRNFNILKQTNDSKKEINSYFFFSSLLLKSLNLNIEAFSNFDDENLNSNLFSLNPTKIHQYAEKDLHVMFEENNLLTIDNLEILCWITSRPSSQNNFNYFDNMLINEHEVHFSKAFQISTKLKKKNKSLHAKSSYLSDFFFYNKIL